MDLGLSGKRALVTGSHRGTGSAIAEILAGRVKDGQTVDVGVKGGHIALNGEAVRAAA